MKRMIKEKWEGNSTDHVRRSSTGCQSSVLSKDMYSPKGIKTANLEEQELIETKELADTRGSDSHSRFSSSPVVSEYHLKSWPISKPTIIEEEQVKFMLIHPQYVEEADNIQSKAFKSGIIHWGLLERLKYHQKCVVHGGTNRPKSIKNKFPVLYTFDTSTQHTRGKARLQSESFASLDHKMKQLIVDEQLNDSRRASTINPFSRDKHVADSHVHNDSCSELKATCAEWSMHLDSGTSVPTSNFLYNTSAATHDTTEI